MSESRCPFAADVQNFAANALRHVATLVTDLRDLYESCRYYTEGAVAVPCPNEPAQTTFLDEPVNASGGGKSDEETPGGVKQAKPEHVNQIQRGRVERIPNVDDAKAVLDGRDKVPIMDYYYEFDRYCAANALYTINRTGKRYLAYCAGYKKLRIDKTTYMIAPSYEEKDV